MDKLRRMAKANNVEYIDKGDGHIQLKGLLLVNYHPNSKNRTAYVAGTRKGIKNVTNEQAIKMTFTPPDKDNLKVKRRKSYRKQKDIMLAKKPYCHWCDCKLTKETATIEHIVPLAKGGLNNMNNYALACEKCNRERGCNMPELKKGE